MPPKPPLTVRVTITHASGGGYTTTIDECDPTVRPARTINWFFSKPDDFPARSILYLRFFTRDEYGAKVDNKGCMQGSDWKDGIGETEPGDRAISGRVRNTAKGSFPYEIKYRLEAGGDHLLLDPEIIVDGNPEPPPIKKKKKKVSLKKARRPAKKKSASKITRKSAKKGPAKRKRAQRSRRGKAKKR